MINNSSRHILLKSIPYMLAIAGGAVLYWLTADKIHTPDLRDLVNNIAASLLSIPLVFLLYDYSNYLISRQLARAQTDNTHDKIDNVLLSTVILMRQIMGLRGTLSLATLNKMSSLRPSDIAPRIKLRPAHIQELRANIRELDDLVYRGSEINLFSMVQIQSLTTLTRNMQHLINVHRFHMDKRDTARYISKIIRFISDWVDSDAAVAMRFQQLITGNNSAAGAMQHKQNKAPVIKRRHNTNKK